MKSGLERRTEQGFKAHGSDIGAHDGDRHQAAVRRDGRKQMHLAVSWG